MIITHTRGQLVWHSAEGLWKQHRTRAGSSGEFITKQDLLATLFLCSVSTSPQTSHKVRTTIIGANGQRGKLRRQKESHTVGNEQGLSPKASSDAGFRRPRLGFHPNRQFCKAPAFLSNPTVPLGGAAHFHQGHIPALTAPHHLQDCPTPLSTTWGTS